MRVTPCPSRLNRRCITDIQEHCDVPIDQWKQYYYYLQSVHARAQLVGVFFNQSMRQFRSKCRPQTRSDIAQCRAAVALAKCQVVKQAAQAYAVR